MCGLQVLAMVATHPPHTTRLELGVSIDVVKGGQV